MKKIISLVIFLITFNLNAFEEKFILERLNDDVTSGNLEAAADWLHTWGNLRDENKSIAESLLVFFSAPTISQSLSALNEFIEKTELGIDDKKLLIDIRDLTVNQISFLKKNKISYSHEAQDPFRQPTKTRYQYWTGLSIFLTGIALMPVAPKVGVSLMGIGGSMMATSTSEAIANKHDYYYENSSKNLIKKINKKLEAKMQSLNYIPSLVSPIYSSLPINWIFD